MQSRLARTLPKLYGFAAGLSSRRRVDLTRPRWVNRFNEHARQLL
jgi:hypothetical protein